MSVRIEKFTFPNKEGLELSARLEWPVSEPTAFALFAHCFTCSKDVIAASRISRALTQHGVAVLRFDFTGLGNSDGDFSNTNFSSNVGDILAAAGHLKKSHQAPQILIGHSLGGAAMLFAASEIAEVRAVVTIGAPSDVQHITHFFEEDLDKIQKQGWAPVKLGGRHFTIQKQFIDDIAEIRLKDRIRHLKKPLLIFHSPQDDVVDISHARDIYEAAVHPKSFISLDGSDHLLSKKEDGEYVADMTASWAKRYLTTSATESQKGRPQLQEHEVFVRSWREKHTQDIYTKDHHLLADEPQSLGGKNLGPSPYDYLLAGLGACTSMTLRMYADHKGWPLEGVEVKLMHEKIHAKDCSECETKTGKIDHIRRQVRVDGPLSEEQRQRLLEIADRCPVHRTLHSEIKEDSELM